MDNIPFILKSEKQKCVCVFEQKSHRLCHCCWLSSTAATAAALPQNCKSEKIPSVYPLNIYDFQDYFLFNLIASGLKWNTNNAAFPFSLQIFFSPANILVNRLCFAIRNNGILHPISYQSLVRILLFSYGRSSEKGRKNITKANAKCVYISSDVISYSYRSKSSKVVYCLTNMFQCCLGGVAFFILLFSLLLCFEHAYDKLLCDHQMEHDGKMGRGRAVCVCVCDEKDGKRNVNVFFLFLNFFDSKCNRIIRLCVSFIG